MINAPSIEVARDDLQTALTGIDLDESEQRTVTWLLNWDQQTLHALASIIRKARET